MTRLITSVWLFCTFTLAGSVMALADKKKAPVCAKGETCNVTQVPEISALEGTAALALVAGLLFLAWERRRHA